MTDHEMDGAEETPPPATNGTTDKCPYEGAEYASWPRSLPPLFADVSLGIVVGNTRCHWGIHGTFQKDFYPSLFWKTGRIEKYNEATQTRVGWISNYFPPEAFQQLFHTEEGPTEEELLAIFASRKVSMLPVYIVSTNDSFLPVLIELLHTMPVRITILRAQDFPCEAYEGCGVDRVTTMTGAVGKYGGPALVIDGGTAMTWTMSDKQGKIQGGGIGPGVAMKFKAMNSFTDKLPDYDFDRINARLDECIKTGKPLKLWAANTEDAMLTCVMHETALTAAHVIRQFHKECSKAKRSTTTVCLTGGDAELLYKLLSKDNRASILPKDQIGLKLPDEVRLAVDNNISHEGIGKFLTDRIEEKRGMDKEDLCRCNAVGQRVAMEIDDELMRGSIVEVIADDTDISKDTFRVWFEDYSVKTMEMTEIVAALNLYSTKGESEEVEGVMMKLRLQDNEKDGSLLLQSSTKKGRAKLSADWISALSKGEAYDPSEIDLEQLPKRKGEDLDGNPAKKPCVPGRPPADEESMRQDPKKYINVRVAKWFLDENERNRSIYFGTVKKYTEEEEEEDEETGVWKVVYDDGDQEDYDVKDLVAQMDEWEVHFENDPKYQ